MKDLASQKISFLEYLELEEKSEVKYEYHDGFVWAMAGGTLNHGTISGNAFSALSSVLRKKDGNNCKPANSEVKIYIEAYNRGVYPDAMVICGEPEFHLNRKDIVVNPSLIIEVLSPSTAAFDRGDKFRFYKSLSSFKEYILITQDQPLVEGFYREEKNLWRISHATEMEESIPIYSLGAEISLKDIYAFIDFSGGVQTRMDL
ncbi:MAG: Uma2 family endonuclease [Chitinophagales bacterium]